MTDAEGNEIGKLFVGGLSQATNNSSLRLYFSRFGEVEDAVVMMDNKTGRSRGFGYVKFHVSESVSLALEAKPHILDGKEVDAKQCNVNMKGRNRRSLKIFVGGIGLDQDVETIRNYFKQFGRVTDVNLMMDSNKQRHRGFAFVGFEDEAVVKRLIGMHYVTINNKQVEIKAMEPPNFGRKLGAVACVAPGSNVLGNSSVGDSNCAQTYEVNPDPGTMISGNLNGLNSTVPYGSHPSYLAPQTPNLSCVQHNLSGQARANSTLAFDNHHQPVYGVSMLSDGLYPSATYLQTMSPTQHAVRNTTDPLLNSSSGKQSLPYISSNPQLHQSNSLAGFPPNASSLYAPFPCSFVPPNPFVPAHPTTAGSVGTLVSAEKTALSVWPGSNLHMPAHVSICPSQLGTQPGLLPCPQFSPSVAAHVGNTTSIIHSGSTGQNIPDASSMLTPYYTMCPQYTAIQLQPDQPGSSSHFSVGNTNPISSGDGLASNSLSTSQADNIDVGLLALPGATTNPIGTSSSRSASPNRTEAKLDANTSHVSLNYPTTTILMPTPNASGYPSNTILQSASSAFNLGRAMWNHPSTNLLYSSIPAGWGISPGQGQSWHSGVPMLPQKLPVVSTPVTTNSLKLTNSSFNPSSPMSNEVVCTNKENALDSSSALSTKASGDGLEGLPGNSEPPSTAYSRTELNADTAYRCSKSQTGSNTLGKDATGSEDEVGGQLNTWPTTESANTLNTGICSGLPSWSRGPALNNIVNGTQWSGVVNNCPMAANMIHPHSWSSPFEMIDENLTNCESSLMKLNSFNVRRSNNATLNNLNRVVPQTANSPNVLNKTGTLETEKANETSGSLLKSPYSRLSQRLNAYDHSSSGSANRRQPVESGSTVQDHSTVAESNGRLQSTLDESTRSSSIGSVLRSDLASSRDGSARLDYGSWLYSSNTSNAPVETITSGNAKELSTPTTVAVEMECQGPAGAAGDFHRPVHTGHFSGYRVPH